MTLEHDVVALEAGPRSSTTADVYRAFRLRVHERICVPARSCTCPSNYGREVLTEARDLAERVHRKFKHPGPPNRCASSHDVICKAVPW